MSTALATAGAEGFPPSAAAIIRQPSSVQASPRVVMEDPAAGHQVVIRMTSRHQIMVSCTCLRDASNTGRPYYTPIDARERFPAAELWDAWADWHLSGGGPR